MGDYSMRKMALIVMGIAMLGGTGLSGCASSGLVNIWMDPQYSAAPMTNILVVAMRPDVAKRRLWEDAFVDALRERGVGATPSYQIFPNALPDTNGMLTAVRDGHYDGCVATVPLASEFLTEDTPGYSTEALVVGYDPWTRRYYDYYEQVYTPGYTETYTIVRHKIEVWNTRGRGALVWTATSEAFAETSQNAVNQGVLGEVIDDLAQHGVIPTKKQADL